MDFWSTILVLLRRWYVALPAFVLSLSAVSLVYTSHPVVYQSKSVILLTVPTTGPTFYAEPGSGASITNPLLNFEDELDNAASILIQILSTPDVVHQMTPADNDDTSYYINNGSGNPELLTNGPFVFVYGESRSPSKAREIVARVTDKAREELMDRQVAVKAKPSTFITFTQMVAPSTPEEQNGDRTRATGAALALGIIARLAATYGTESALEARARHRSGRPAGRALRGDQLIKARHRRPNIAAGARVLPTEHASAYIAESSKGSVNDAAGSPMRSDSQ